MNAHTLGRGSRYIPPKHGGTRRLARRLQESIEAKYAAAAAILVTSSSAAWRAAAAAPVRNLQGLRARVEPGVERVKLWLTFVIKYNIEYSIGSPWVMLMLSEAEFKVRCSKALPASPHWTGPADVDAVAAALESMRVMLAPGAPGRGGRAAR